MQNTLRLRRVKRLSALKPGQRTLMGPYRTANSVSAEIARHGNNHHYTQKQMLLIDPVNCKMWKIWLVTRT
jgi:hypothetical protein